jgi:hypothetical protein
MVQGLLGSSGSTFEPDSWPAGGITMTTLFVRHEVADYAAWRRVYDGFSPTQKALGVQDQAVYQAIDNPNDITVRHEFATLEAAQAFSGSPELRTAMHDAGVEGAPTIWFTTRS